MATDQHILDNRARRLVDYLQQHLPATQIFRIVSAYFSVYGYEALQDALNQVDDIRFLFGDPASVGELDPGKKESQSFTVTEDGLSPNRILQQKHLAKACAEWIAGHNVSIRSIGKTNFLHGKMYLAEAEGRRASVVGSSNFTRSGLGCGAGANLEINLATTDEATHTELREWFDDLWTDDNMTRDVKQDVLAVLNRLGKEHAPELIYYKTLYELFLADIEARRDGERQLADIHLYDTQIWQALYNFQKDGAISIINRLKARGGCILADSVGLGKTWTALAVIKYFELQNENVLVLCPKKLRENWALYPVHNAQRNNPFAADRFGYTLLSHTDLSRNTGMADSVDLANFNWSSFKLIVIDESHNFRNDRRPYTNDKGEWQHSRYSRLLEEVIKDGVRTKVLMLSATPVNTSLIDLRNQIYLMTERRDDTFRESLGISNIGQLLNAAQRQFKQWETSTRQGQRDKAKLLESLGADFLRLQDAVSIARSRRQIKTFYADEMERIGRFPDHAVPDNRYPPTDRDGGLSYQVLAEQIDRFTLSVYRPSDYLVDETRRQQLAEEKNTRNFNQADRENFLVAMMRTNFLKRLESSAHSLTLTLARTIGKIDGLLEQIGRYEKSLFTDNGEVIVQPEEDEDDEEFFINRARHPYHLRELDLRRWKEDLRRDHATLRAAHDRIAAVTPQRDGKLHEIRQAIRHKAEHPSIDQDGKPNRKLLVFTTFKDTAKYLYDNLSSLAKELGLNLAMVSGDETRTTCGPNNFNAILTNFAPRARGRTDAETGEIDLLIATDCISEGQNLQDCDTVLNYDIHWNPVRLIQRFGRIDRMGSRSRAVCMLNYWPTRDMDAYLRLKSRVQARMALADVAASGDEDPFTEDDAQLDLDFRDRQLLKLREEVLDLDGPDDAPAMSDFTLDYFFAQLLRYLEKNRNELEATLLGACAVTRPADGPAGSGVIFFLRQLNANTAPRPGQRIASPIHPFYAVHIGYDGYIRFGCANARQVLEAFEAATAGKTDAILSLCDRFNAETDNGRNMARYDALLNQVLKHISQMHVHTQLNALKETGNRGVTLPTADESPDTDNFELVTWLVIGNPDGQPGKNTP